MKTVNRNMDEIKSRIGQAAAGNEDAQEALEKLNNQRQALKEQEEYFLQLVEEKQLELIWHPEQREKCSIFFKDEEYRAQIIYIYRDDCPMSAFREFGMFLLLLFYAGNLAEAGKSWIQYAALAANYLRKLPAEIRDRHLGFFYARIASLYEENGDSRRSGWYWERTVVYQLSNEFNLENVVKMQDGMSEEQMLDFYLYVMHHIAELGCFGEDEFYPCWHREQYELMEYVQNMAVERFVDNEEQSTLVRSFILFLKAVYLKRTRRYTLAEATLKQYMSLPECENDGHWMVEDVIYALLGECCLYGKDCKQAEIYFQKMKEKESFVWKYVQSLLLGNASPDELNQVCYEAVADACCQNNVTEESMKNAIDAFFAPPEMYDDKEEDEEEEEADEENGEMPEYTFDEWYELAEAGKRVAQLVVGYAYYKGEGVTRNYRLAREWFYLAALQGDAVAQLNLSHMYANGYGTDVNLQEAKKWREKVQSGNCIWNPYCTGYLLTGNDTIHSR